MTTIDLLEIHFPLLEIILHIQYKSRLFGNFYFLCAGGMGSFKLKSESGELVFHNLIENTSS